MADFDESLADMQTPMEQDTASGGGSTRFSFFGSSTKTASKREEMTEMTGTGSSGNSPNQDADSSGGDPPRDELEGHYDKKDTLDDTRKAVALQQHEDALNHICEELLDIGSHSKPEHAMTKVLQMENVRTIGAFLSMADNPDAYTAAGYDIKTSMISKIQGFATWYRREVEGLGVGNKYLAIRGFTNEDFTRYCLALQLEKYKSSTTVHGHTKPRSVTFGDSDSEDPESVGDYVPAGPNSNSARLHESRRLSAIHASGPRMLRARADRPAETIKDRLRERNLLLGTLLHHVRLLHSNCLLYRGLLALRLLETILRTFLAGEVVHLQEGALQLARPVAVYLSKLSFPLRLGHLRLLREDAVLLATTTSSLARNSGRSGSVLRLVRPTSISANKFSTRDILPTQTITTSANCLRIRNGSCIRYSLSVLPKERRLIFYENIRIRGLRTLVTHKQSTQICATTLKVGLKRVSALWLSKPS